MRLENYLNIFLLSLVCIKVSSNCQYRCSNGNFLNFFTIIIFTTRFSGIFTASFIFLQGNSNPLQGFIQINDLHCGPDSAPKWVKVKIMLNNYNNMALFKFI